jgi:voltage-gated potassium channel
MTAPQRRRLAAVLAPPMNLLSVTFLVAMAALVVMWVDMPSISERTFADDTAATQAALPAAEPVAPSPAAAATTGTGAAGELGADETLAWQEVPAVAWLPLQLMLLIWPLFFAEMVVLWLIRPWTARYRPHHWRSLAHALVPPLRMGARNPDLGEAIWLPVLGWRRPDQGLRETLAKCFSLPMLAIAVLILPVLAIEFFLQSQVHRYPALRYGLHFSTGLIWFAFALEFIVMVSAAERKLVYCKQHWLDLAIILLPLISFLRSLQVLRATRLAKLTKMQQLTKMARVYRLRGVSTKALRALILFELVHRLLRWGPEKQLARLRREEAELDRTLTQLRRRIESLEEQLEEEQRKRELCEAEGSGQQTGGASPEGKPAAGPLTVDSQSIASQ